MLTEYDLSNYHSRYNCVTVDVLERLDECLKKFAKHPSLEHSFMVLQEEFEELKKELYKKESERDNDRIYDEGIDLLATVFRLLLDNDLYKLRLDFKYDSAN